MLTLCLCFWNPGEIGLALFSEQHRSSTGGSCGRLLRFRLEYLLRHCGVVPSQFDILAQSWSQGGGISAVQHGVHGNGTDRSGRIRRRWRLLFRSGRRSGADGPIHRRADVSSLSCTVTEQHQSTYSLSTCSFQLSKHLNYLNKTDTTSWLLPSLRHFKNE